MGKPNYSYIWSFDPQDTSSNEAPKLKGVNGSGASSSLLSTNIGQDITPDIPAYTYVDVSRDYTWTLNNERDEVPRIILKEFVQNASALLQRSSYFLSQTTDIVGGYGGVLGPYKGLYATDDTGFYYDLPNITGDYLSTGPNKFGEEQKKLEDLAKQAGNVVGTMVGGTDTMLGGAVSTITGLPGNLTALGKIAADMIGKGREAIGDGGGYYTEQPQFYQHGGNSRNYEITFPLFNTGDYDDMIRNFQLAFMLVYQNLPNRQSKQLVLPPCIYEVTVPGISYTPYAYMQSVDVRFVGSRREMNIAIPFDSPGNYQTIRVTIPEAYDIRLNVQELVGHTKNFMYYNMKRKVSTGISSIDSNLAANLSTASQLANFDPNEGNYDTIRQAQEEAKKLSGLKPDQVENELLIPPEGE